MPSATDILAGLATIAQRAFALAVLFHVLIALSAAAWLSGLRPSARAIAMSLSVPLASVAAVAFWFGNPFNGAVFAALAIALLLLAHSAATPELAPALAPLRALGIVLILFGLTYPHFLHDRSPLAYLYGAPLGLIPCPTLAFAIGVTLLGMARAGRAWCRLLALAGIFYALYGVLRLAVALDLVLLAGALALLLLPSRERRAMAAAS